MSGAGGHGHEHAEDRRLLARAHGEHPAERVGADHGEVELAGDHGEARARARAARAGRSPGACCRRRRRPAARRSRAGEARNADHGQPQCRRRAAGARVAPRGRRIIARPAVPRRCMRTTTAEHEQSLDQDLHAGRGAADEQDVRDDRDQEGAAQGAHRRPCSAGDRGAADEDGGDGVEGQRAAEGDVGAGVERGQEHAGEARHRVRRRPRQSRSPDRPAARPRGRRPGSRRPGTSAARRSYAAAATAPARSSDQQHVHGQRHAQRRGVQDVVVVGARRRPAFRR